MSEGEAREGDKDINTHNTEGTESDLTGETRFASPAESLESLNTIGPVDTVASSNTENGDSPTLVSVQHERGRSIGAVENVGELSKDRYRVHQKLGSGGMGVVKLADDLLIQRQVAVKTLRGRESAKAKDGFLRESRVQGRLQHPNIVTIYDAGVLDSGELAIVMQYSDCDAVHTGSEFVRDSRKSAGDGCGGPQTLSTRGEIGYFCRSRERALLCSWRKSDSL